jgi:hypothetical protein
LDIPLIACMWISKMYCEPSIGIAIATKIVGKMTRNEQIYGDSNYGA